MMMSASSFWIFTISILTAVSEAAFLSSGFISSRVFFMRSTRSSVLTILEQPLSYLQMSCLFSLRLSASSCLKVTMNSMQEVGVTQKYRFSSAFSRSLHTFALECRCSNSSMQAYRQRRSVLLRNLVATWISPSFGHSSNQSMVVQFTRLGNIRSRTRKASPMGLKQMISLSWSRMRCRKKLKIISMETSPRASAASLRTASQISIFSYWGKRLGTVPRLRMLLMSSRNCSSLICVSEKRKEMVRFLTPISRKIFLMSSRNCRYPQFLVISRLMGEQSAMKEASCAKDFRPLPPMPTSSALVLGCRMMRRMISTCLRAYSNSTRSMGLSLVRLQLLREEATDSCTFSRSPTSSQLRSALRMSLKQTLSVFFPHRFPIDPTISATTCFSEGSRRSMKTRCASCPQSLPMFSEWMRCLSALQMPITNFHRSRRLKMQCSLAGVGRRRRRHSLQSSMQYLSMVGICFCSAWLWKDIMRMVVKMRVRVSSSKLVTEITLRWRRKRGVMSLLMAAMEQRKARSMVCLNIFSFSLKSQKPPWSTSCLRNSMGGCAPYFSLTGMLRSSTKMMALGMPFGPTRSFLPRLSSRPSTCSCTCVQLVLELNTTSRKAYCLWSTFKAQKSFTSVVLPVPVGPTRMVGMPSWRLNSRQWLQRTMSAVLTMISWICMDLGQFSSSMSFHRSHSQLSLSQWRRKRQSKRVCFSGKDTFFFFLEVMSPTSSFLKAWSNSLREGVSTERPNDHTTAQMNMPVTIVTLYFSSITPYSSGELSRYRLRMTSCESSSLKKEVSRLKMDTKQMVLKPLKAAYSSSMMMKFSVSILMMSSGIHSLRFSQEVMMIWCPTEAGSRQIMPQRLTVAGEAASRSMGSKMRLMGLLIEMISPELRQSFLLSSSTVFMFSIQTASTGPSSSSHLREGVVAVANCLNLTASTPSNHSWETSSKYPQSCFCVMDLGFILQISTQFSRIFSLHLPMDRAKMSIAVDLPENGQPTIMRPWRTSTMSQIWMILSRMYWLRVRLRRPYSSVISSMRWEQLISGDWMLGKRSLVMPAKRGMSKARNLATLTSLMALRMREDSSRCWFFRFRLPAATSTLFTARIPQSQCSCDDSCSEHSLQVVTILRARERAWSKPQEQREISAIMAQSGIIMATERKRALRLSGSSERPAYPGFMVMKQLALSMRLSSTSSKKSFRCFLALAAWMHRICCATTDSTSRLMRLNSSKHDHAPDAARPLKNLPIALQSRPSEQLKTTHWHANAFARSFTVSVFPVPAGPSGAPPQFRKMAEHRVRQHRSVRGVMTSLEVFPRYSQLKETVALRILTSVMFSRMSVLQTQQQRSWDSQENSEMDLTARDSKFLVTSRLCTERTMRDSRVRMWMGFRSDFISSTTSFRSR